MFLEAWCGFTDSKNTCCLVRTGFLLLLSQKECTNISRLIAVRRGCMWECLHKRAPSRWLFPTKTSSISERKLGVPKRIVFRLLAAKLIPAALVIGLPEKLGACKYLRRSVHIHTLQHTTLQTFNRCVRFCALVNDAISQQSVAFKLASTRSIFLCPGLCKVLGPLKQKERDHCAWAGVCDANCSRNSGRFVEPVRMPAMEFAHFEKRKNLTRAGTFLVEIMESTFIFQLSNSARTSIILPIIFPRQIYQWKSQTAEHSLKSRSAELCSKLSIKHAQDISHLPFVCSISWYECT